MRRTVRVTYVRDCDIVPMLIVDKRQPRRREQGDAFVVLDECYDPVAADIMAPNFRADPWLSKFALDKCLEILTRVIPSDQEYIVS